MSDYRYDAVVVEVHDGDTVVLDVDLGFGVWMRGMHVRMFGMNAPELNTPAGKESQRFMAGMIPVGKPVLFFSEKDKADKYGGRWLGTIYLPSVVPSSFASSVNQTSILSGFAKPWDGKGVKPV